MLVVGAGNMGRAVATRALAGGHRVRIADRERERAQAVAEDLAGDVAAVELDGPGQADVVVLALPYPADREIAAQWADALAGTTVVDVANPVDFSSFDDVVTPPGTSAAEQVARAAPQARVVKAFNTTFAGNLAGDTPLDVFIAADDELAAERVATLATDGGLRPIRVGGLKHARALEAFQLLHMKVQDQIGGGFRTSLTMQPV